MALNEQDREDLWRDGRAMPIRGEITVDSAVWLVGFRRQGQVSFYAGSDRVFQFNLVGELRRVFVAGERFAAENGRLQRLRTLGRGQRLQLTKEPLTDQEQHAIQAQLTCCLHQLEQLANQHEIPWKTEGITVTEFLAKLLSWLPNNGRESRIANTPNVG